MEEQKVWFCENSNCRANVLVAKSMARSGILVLRKPVKPQPLHTCEKLTPTCVYETIRANRILLKYGQRPNWSMWVCSLCWDDKKEEFK